MSASTPEPTPEVAYPISYEVYGGSARNQDFKGQGRLAIRSEGPTYVFRGKKRALFAGDPVEAEFGAHEIWNVEVAGRRLAFRTTRGAAGAKTRIFVFYCADVAAAKEVAGLLPAHVDEEFTAARDFVTRLNALAGPRSPWTSVTNGIVGLNVISFVVMGCLGAGWIEVDNLMPYIRYGANNGAATTDGEWWRLLTSMFMHYGVLHLVLNMYALFQAGHFLEKLQGRLLYALTYVGSGIAGGLVSIALHGDKTWSVGASGAIFGVYGAILGYLLREKHGVPSGIFQPMLKSTLLFAGYNILYGLRGNIDNSAHVGGLFGGFVLGWLLALPVDAAIRQQKTASRLGLGLAAVAALVAAGIGFTPRFDYSIRDVLLWQDALKGRGAQETALLQRHESAMKEIDRGADGTAHAAWMASDLIPFYEGWDRQIMALPLEPGRTTIRQRDVLDRIFQMRVEAYRHLVDALRAHNAEGVRQYYIQEQRIVAEIEKLKKA